MCAARVLNPTMLGRNLPCVRQLDRVKCNLFGAASPSETNKMFTEDVEKQQEKASKRWGFDFRAGRPLQCNPQYIWERVSFPETNYTPEIYTLTHAAHVRPTPSSPTSMEMLMNERADRENFTATESDSCDDSQDESMPVAFKLPAALVGCSSSNVGRVGTAVEMNSRMGTKRRQPKITEYMKERKRLAQTPKKSNSSPPAKRMRTSSGSSGSSSRSSIHTHSIAMHFVMQRNRNQN